MRGRYKDFLHPRQVNVIRRLARGLHYLSMMSTLSCYPRIRATVILVYRILTVSCTNSKVSLEGYITCNIAGNSDRTLPCMFNALGEVISVGNNTFEGNIKGLSDRISSST